MTQSVVVVKAAFDPEASVWFVESSDVEGLNLEGSSLEDLLAKLPAAVGDLLDADGSAGAVAPIELIAHAGARANLGRAG